MGRHRFARNFAGFARTFAGLPRKIARFGAVAILLALTIVPTQAHKPITSKYTYTADVLPIFRSRCGACHAPGRAAPMSLLGYKEAVPWAESIREELLDEKMPPWYVEPGATQVAGAQGISPKEIDTIVTWATGGTPEGAATSAAADAPPHDAWPAGPPDLIVAMDADHTMPPERQDEIFEAVLPVPLDAPRAVTLADLQPGATDLVRDATIAIEDGPLLAVWMPGEIPVRTPAGTAFAMPAHARIRLRIHYKKPWQDDRKARGDRSRVGLYFAKEAAARPVATLSLSPAAAGDSISQQPSTTRTPAIADAARIISLRPLLDRPYAELDVQAVLPSGARVPLLRLHRPRPEWSRRYWLETPVDLPAGAHIEMRATPAAIDPDEPAPPRAGALQLAVDFVTP